MRISPISALAIVDLPEAKKRIRSVFEESKGNVSLAAATLGLSRRGWYKLIDRLKLKLPAVVGHAPSSKPKT
jgi:hypothetical protein